MKNIPVYKDIYSDEKPVISKPLLEFTKNFFFAKADYQFFDTQTRKRGIYIFFRWKRPLKAHKSDTDRQTTYTGKDISNSKVRKQFLFFIKQRRTETFT